MAGEIEARLKALDLVLPEVPAPVADYVSYPSPQRPALRGGPIAPEGRAHRRGRHPRRRVSTCRKVRTPRGSAASTSWLRQRPHFGDLDRIVQCLRLTGYVNAAPQFVDHPKVINGASELIVKVLGQKGRHTRIAVGCSGLPLGAAVEIDAIFAVD